MNLLPHPAQSANKYSRGGVLVVGGSVLYPSAPVLAVKAAARTGAGYAKLATCRDAAVVAHMHLLSIPVSACAQEEGTLCLESLQDVLRAGAKSSAFVAGPGMGTTALVASFLKELLAHLACPAVLDADALNIIARDSAMLTDAANSVRIITPHEGEAVRLLGHAVEDRVAAVRELANRLKAVAVLKGPGTLISDGVTTYVCNEGGPELAKAGSGDVLAGMIGALLAQGLNALDAASVGVYLHGRAGRYAAQKLSDISVMPEDLIEHIGPAIVQWERELQ